MIFQFLIPISLAVCIVFAWGAYALPFSAKGKFFFFALNVFGLAYVIPIGPLLDPARYLPYPLVLGLASLSAFAFFYFWIKIMQIGIVIILFIISIWYKKNKVNPKCSFHIRQGQYRPYFTLSFHHALQRLRNHQSPAYETCDTEL